MVNINSIQICYILFTCILVFIPHAMTHTFILIYLAIISTLAPPFVPTSRICFDSGPAPLKLRCPRFPGSPSPISPEARLTTVFSLHYGELSAAARYPRRIHRPSLPYHVLTCDNPGSSYYAAY